MVTAYGLLKMRICANSVCLVRWFWWTGFVGSLRYIALRKPGIAHHLEHLVDVIDEGLEERKSVRGWGVCVQCCAGSEEKELQRQRVLARDIARSNEARWSVQTRKQTLPKSWRIN